MGDENVGVCVFLLHVSLSDLGILSRVAFQPEDDGLNWNLNYSGVRPGVLEIGIGFPLEWRQVSVVD